MNEKDLIELWNDKRRQIISAQMPSVIALAVITVMAMLGYFDGEYNYGISFAALFLVSVGALSVLNQLAVIREGQMIIKDLQGVDNPSALATRIAASGSYLVYTRALMIVFSLALLLVLVLLILQSISDTPERRLEIKKDAVQAKFNGEGECTVMWLDKESGEEGEYSFKGEK